MTTASSQSITAQSINCQSCAAPLELPKNFKGSTRCQYCDAENFIKGMDSKNAEIAAKENINSGIPFTLTPAMLHLKLVEEFYGQPFTPIDIFEKIEVSERRFFVPAYVFYCNAAAPFTYEAGNVRERADRTKYIEYTQMSSSVTTTATLLAPGNKESLADLGIIHYYFYNPANPHTPLPAISFESLSASLVDIEELDLPNDAIMLDYNIPSVVAFNEYTKPQIEAHLVRSAENTLHGMEYRNLKMGGSNIQKDKEVRILIGVYQLSFEYEGKSYSYNITGDGSNSWYTVEDDFPYDDQRDKAYGEKKQAIEKLPKGTGWLTFGIVMTILASPFTLGLLLLLLIPLFKARKKKMVAYRERYNILKNDFDQFDSQWTDAVARFKAEKKGLRGVYRDAVTGDESAF